MDEQLLESLANELQTEFNALEHLKPGSEEYSRHVANIEKLWKLGQAEVKAAQDLDDIAYERERDIIKDEKEARDKKIDRAITIGKTAAEITIPTAVYVALYKKGLKFEETGTVSSSFFRDLIRRLPFRK